MVTGFLSVLIVFFGTGFGDLQVYDDPGFDVDYPVEQSEFVIRDGYTQ